jgi:hypothetical protein
LHKKLIDRERGTVFNVWTIEEGTLEKLSVTDPKSTRKEKRAKDNW